MRSKSIKVPKELPPLTQASLTEYIEALLEYGQVPEDVRGTIEAILQCNQPEEQSRGLLPAGVLAKRYGFSQFMQRFLASPKSPDSQNKSQILVHLLLKQLTVSMRADVRRVLIKDSRDKAVGDLFEALLANEADMAMIKTTLAQNEAGMAMVKTTLDQSDQQAGTSSEQNDLESFYESIQAAHALAEHLRNNRDSDIGMRNFRARIYNAIDTACIHLDTAGRESLRSKALELGNIAYLRKVSRHFRANQPPAPKA